jgi:hypothetical protein
MTSRLPLLAAQSTVKFALTPEREAGSATPRAAVVQFDVPHAWRYRVSTGSRHRIDA